MFRFIELGGSIDLLRFVFGAKGRKGDEGSNGGGGRLTIVCKFLPGGYKNINMLSIRLYDFLKDSGHDKQMNDFPPFAGSCCLY